MYGEKLERLSKSSNGNDLEYTSPNLETAENSNIFKTV